ncbi:alpha/beta fold hydrolase [Nocardioides silvaticus]|uniref:alpha/beta fold hydrolase n=1 Tax=Nocardioides silvaticus TaxID=2201891 RepID=UPI001304E3A3|nr:alpha/beta hydrolase [Nocardioides silvaticus]
MPQPSRPAQSAFLDIGGPVHVADHGGPPGAPVLLCVHGLGASAVSWGRFADALTSDHRVLAVDLPGHGLSPRAGRSVAVRDNARLLHEVLAAVGPAVLVGHSMGGALAMLQASSRPAHVRGLVLLALPMPRVPWEPMTPALALRVALCAWPWLGRTALATRFRRLGPEEFVRRALALTCSSAEAVDEETRQLLVQRAEVGDADDHATFVEAASSVGLLVARAAVYRRTIAAVPTPGMVVHGGLDRLVPAAGLDELAALQPGWTTAVMPGVGHSPHLEAPDEVAGQVRAFTRTLATARRPIGTSAHLTPRRSAVLEVREEAIVR